MIDVQRAGVFAFWIIGAADEGAFTFGSAALTQNAKREIDQFLGDLEGSTGSGSRAASERVFVVAGYTDSVGQEGYNYLMPKHFATAVQRCMRRI
jgi:outer membrane protein OmpA-like peptidoglycan-associated protein